jgi:hypothetical protein
VASGSCRARAFPGPDVFCVNLTCTNASSERLPAAEALREAPCYEVGIVLGTASADESSIWTANGPDLGRGG